jgi:hypothetical protein
MASVFLLFLEPTAGMPGRVSTVHANSQPKSILHLPEVTKKYAAGLRELPAMRPEPPRLGYPAGLDARSVCPARLQCRGRSRDRAPGDRRGMLPRWPIITGPLAKTDPGLAIQKIP